MHQFQRNTQNAHSAITVITHKTSSL